MTGITSVESVQFNFNLTSSNWLTWSPPLFSSENSMISYHIYIKNQHDQLLYNDTTEDTSYELYNLTVCDIYTATVIAIVENIVLMVLQYKGNIMDVCSYLMPI